MPTSDTALKAMANAIMQMQSQMQAQEFLLKALYMERATQRDTFPQEAEEEVLALATLVDQLERTGFEGEERHLADVQSALRGFAASLRQRLDEQRH